MGLKHQPNLEGGGMGGHVILFKNQKVDIWLLSLVRQHDSPLSPEKLFRIEFSSEHDADMPIVPIVAQTLMYLWGSGQVARQSL